MQIFRSILIFFLSVVYLCTATTVRSLVKRLGSRIGFGKPLLLQIMAEMPRQFCQLFYIRRVGGYYALNLLTPSIRHFSTQGENRMQLATF